jgi:hypothetical protein
LARSVAKSVAAFAVAALCFFAGGWPWAVIALATFCFVRNESALGVAAIGLFWLALFHLTGDRRLFFPFSIQFALQAAFSRGIFASASIVAIFLTIRVAQGASASVLGVEILVAAVVVGASIAGYRRTAGGFGARVGWSAVGSVMAALGLAL